MLITAGTLGDFFPFLKLAEALSKRGHRITFLGSESHSEHVTKKGIPFHSIFSREEFNQITNEPDLWHPQKGVRILFESISRRIKIISDFLATLPEEQGMTLICHPLVLPSTALFRRSRKDVRIVGAYLAPSNLRSFCDPMTLGELRIPRWFPLLLRRWLWQLVDRIYIDPFIVPALNDARKARGLAPVTHFFEHMQAVPDLSISFFPRWFHETPLDWPKPMHRANFPLYDPNPINEFSEELKAFLVAGSAPVVFTPGTGNRHAADYFNRIAKI